MVKIFIEDQEFNIIEGESLQQVCENWGIPFGCTEGICGTCRIEVLEGADNLNELTQEEKDMGMSKTDRLACQCKIKNGCVKIQPW